MAVAEEEQEAQQQQQLQQQQQQQKKMWEGKARAKVKQVRAEQVWSLFDEDFCNFHKWLPTIDTCHQIEGIKGQPGLVRYCASSGNHEKETMWCNEKLVSIDPVMRCLSYEILNNNLGFKSYFATFKVLQLPPPSSSSSEGEVATNNGELELGCEIEWSFLCDPVDGMTCEILSSYVDNTLQGIVHNIEKAFCNQSN